MDIEDKLLYLEIKNRNLKIYESLFHYYYPQLVRFAEGYIFDQQHSEDIVQNLFINFWENADKIELTSSIKAYFFQSIKNRCLNFLRDLQIHDRHNILYLEALLNQSNDSELQDPEITIRINDAIAQLPGQMAEIIRLKYFEGKKINEIAQISNVTQNTVKTHLRRAKNKLQKALVDIQFHNNIF